MDSINVLTFNMWGVPVGEFSKFALVVIMVSMGLTLSVSNFSYVIKRPGPIFVGLGGQLLFLPLVGFILCLVFDLRADIAVGLMIIASCPGAATSNFMTYLARGELALSITLTAVTGLITVFTIPLILDFSLSFFELDAQGVSLPILSTIWNIFLLTGLPVIFGMLIRHYYPSLAELLEKILTPLSFLALLSVMFMTLREIWPILGELLREALAPVFLLNLIMVTLGLLAARSFGFASRTISTIGIEVGFQNYVLGIVIALGMLQEPRMSIPAIIYLFSMYVTAIIIIVVSRKRHKQIDQKAAG